MKLPNSHYRSPGEPRFALEPLLGSSIEIEADMNSSDQDSEDNGIDDDNDDDNDNNDGDDGGELETVSSNHSSSQPEHHQGLGEIGMVTRPCFWRGAP